MVDSKRNAKQALAHLLEQGVVEDDPLVLEEAVQVRLQMKAGFLVFEML